MSYLLELFKKPTAAVLAQRELEESQRLLLTAQSLAEYGASQATYQQNKIRRLQRMLEISA